MSIHRSLVIIGKLRRHRNVLKKSERLERLLSDGKPIDEITVFGLPKFRNIMAKVKPKPKKEAAAEGAAPVAGAEGAVAATAGAKAAPGAKAPAATAGKAAPGAKAAAPAAGKPAAKADAPKAGKK